MTVAAVAVDETSKRSVVVLRVRQFEVTEDTGPYVGSLATLSINIFVFRSSVIRSM